MGSGIIWEEGGRWEVGSGWEEGVGWENYIYCSNTTVKKIIFCLNVTRERVEILRKIPMVINFKALGFNKKMLKTISRIIKLQC